jgi:MFS family permease
MILYLSYWFPARARSRAISRFMVASPIAGVLGNPISGVILRYLDQVGGLPGWQWLFLLEGLPAVMLGIAAWLYLTDRPEHAHWLKPEERDWLAQRMSREEKHREERHGFTIFQSMASPRILLLSALYFTVAMGSNTFGVYLPKIIKAQIQRAQSQVALDQAGVPVAKPQPNDNASTSSSGTAVASPQAPAAETKVAVDPLRIGILAAIPSLIGMIGMVLGGMQSDHTGERRKHVSGAAFLAAAGWGLSWYCQAGSSEWQLVLAMTLAQVGMMSMLGPFWTLPTSFLHGAAAAAGIAFINSLGNLGGFVGQNAMGYSAKATGSYAAGSLALGGVLLVGSVLALLARHDATVETVAVEPSA